MKRIIACIIISLLFITGCDNTINTPTSKVEEYLSKYQNLDKEVLNDLDKVINNDDTMTKDQKKEYKNILEKQYQNLSYKIKNETINDDIAEVDVEIEVLNYHSTITNAREYFIEHQEEFESDIDEIDKDKKYIDYKIKQLKTTNDRIYYDITFKLKKEKNMWQLDQLQDDDLKKIHGLY